MLANMVCSIYTPGNAVLLVLVLLAMQKLPRQATRVSTFNNIMMGTSSTE
jgi:hypothetical protein